MNSIDKLTLLRGAPIKFDKICTVYQATIGQIADIGLDKFYQYLFMLTSDPQQTYKLKQPISTFHFLFMQSLINPEFLITIQDAFYFFIHQKIHFLYETQQIQIGQDIQNRRTFVADNYQQFINILDVIYKMKNVTNRPESAADKKAREIAQKLQRGRQQVQKIKAKKGINDDQIDLQCLISSLGLYYQNINVVWSLSYYAFFDQVARMQYKQNYDNNIVFSAAGAKIPKDKMKYWIRKVQDSKGG